jgi:hypothetical protein
MPSVSNCKLRDTLIRTRFHHQPDIPYASDFTRLCYKSQPKGSDDEQLKKELLESNEDVIQLDKHVRRLNQHTGILQGQTTG